MSKPFRKVRFMAVERPAGELAELETPISFAPGEQLDVPALARHYLDRVLELDLEAVTFGVDGAGKPEVALRDVQPSRLTDSQVVRFAQAHGSIPIFGSHLVVEVGADGKLVNVDAEVAAVEGTSLTPSLTPQDAAARLAAFAGVDAATIASTPTLTLYHDEDEADRWHLAWFFRDIAAEPPPSGPTHRGHGCSPRRRHALFHYLVDAHDGEILLHYSAAPRASARVPEIPAIPIKCWGVDELGERQEFHGQAVDGGFSLVDPLRKIRTFDLEAGNISVERIRLPKDPLQHAEADFGDDHRAAVSAHVNVGRVLDFFRAVLMRDGVDDRGMEIVSIVNCVSSADEEPPEWKNAMWWDDRMWYGQIRRADGTMRSFSGYLDIIAHELMHGVTERTANLIYHGQSGALNESYSDILALIINNWYTRGPDSDPDRWTWEIGPELGEGGKPLRDFRDPRRTGDPAHMSEYKRMRDDDGGVHWNSNIHNKAVYHLLTARDGAGARALTAREAAILYYLCLVRLPQRATFVRSLNGLLDVATVYFAGDPAARDRKLAAIRDAYAQVGITTDDESREST